MYKDFQLLEIPIAILELSEGNLHYNVVYWDIERDKKDIRSRDDEK